MKINIKKRKVKVALSFLIAVITLAITVSAGAPYELSPGNAVVSSSLNFGMSTVKNASAVFQKSDFEVRLNTSRTIDGIVITDLPDMAAGSLKINGAEVLAYQPIAWSDIDKLEFVPVMDYTGMASFCFKAFSGNSIMKENALMTIRVLEIQKSAPIAKDVSVVTQRNISIEQIFKAYDPIDSELTFHIVDTPKLGTVKLSENTWGGFVYTPYTNKTGTDTFTYRVEDEYKNTSTVATVTVKIVKPSSATSYEDMEGDSAYYPAIKLSEMGVITGETLAGRNFFRPDYTVSRGDFLVMLMNAFNMDKNLKPVVNTGFADDTDIPAWMKKYVGEAYSLGIINGSSDGSLLYFKPCDIITRSEAVVMMNNLIGANNYTSNTALFYDLAVPVWAMQSFIDLNQKGVVTASINKTLRPNDCLTRGEAACFIWQLLSSES